MKKEVSSGDTIWSGQVENHIQAEEICDAIFNAFLNRQTIRIVIFKKIPSDKGVGKAKPKFAS
jgi:hypothetical protein